MVESLLNGDRGEVFLWSGSVLVHGESKRRVCGAAVGCGSVRSCVDVRGCGTAVVGVRVGVRVNRRRELSWVGKNELVKE